MSNVTKIKSAEDGTEATADTDQPARGKRGRRVLLMLLVPLALAAGGAWIWLSGGRFEETENAYLHKPRVAIASDLSGRVTDVEVADNEAVEEGDVLFRIDPEPYRLALSEADAAIASARLQVEQMKAAYQEKSRAGGGGPRRGRLPRQGAGAPACARRSRRHHHRDARQRRARPAQGQGAAERRQAGDRQRPRRA